MAISATVRAAGYRSVFLDNWRARQSLGKTWAWRPTNLKRRLPRRRCGIQQAAEIATPFFQRGNQQHNLEVKPDLSGEATGATLQIMARLSLPKGVNTRRPCNGGRRGGLARCMLPNCRHPRSWSEPALALFRAA